MAFLPDLYIGRLGLPTIEDPITEQLGSQVTNVGDATAVGQRKAKGFTMNFIVHGFDATSSVALGNRLRRQLRSLMQNPGYRLGGLYMNFAPDKERNGWLVIGEAELADADGGVSFGSYKLSLSQAFIVGQIATHREGYRVDLTDLRLTYSPIDYAGQVINVTADFAALPLLPLVAVPSGATDLDVLGSTISSGARTGRDGSCPICNGSSNGDVISWDRGESAFNMSDVVAYDRRGQLTAPLTGPDTAWEEVYGPDYPYSWTGSVSLAAPTGVTAAPSAAGGVLPTGNRFYVVVATYAIPNTQFVQRSVQSAEVTAAVVGPNGSVQLAWNAVPNATGYEIYEAGAAGLESTQPSLLATVAAVTSFTDTGAAAAFMNTYVVPGTTFVSNICIGPDGNMWFSVEGGSNKVGTITTAGVITTYTVGTPGDNFAGINPGPDGNLWLADNTAKTVFVINTAGTVLQSIVVAAGVGGIVAGSDGFMYLISANTIAKISPTTYTVTNTFTVPTAGAQPHGLNIGPDGNIWFCEEASGVSKIASVTPSGVFTEWALPVNTSQPFIVHRGADGAMWFTEVTGNQIGRLTLAGQITEYGIPTAASGPRGITLGPNGSMWFAEATGNKLGVLNTGQRGPVVQTAGNDLTSGGSTITVTLPKTASSGNLLLLFASSRTGTTTINTPAGWTQFGAQVNGTGCSAAVFYKYSAGTETAVTITNSGSNIMGQVYEISGAVTSNPIDTAASAVATATSITTAAVTPSTGNSFVVAGVVKGGGNIVWPSTWTNGFTQDLSIGGRAECASRVTTSRAAITTNETMGASASAAAFAIVIKMAAVYPTKPALIQEIPVTAAASVPDKVIIGPDQNIWFTEHDAHTIGNIMVNDVSPTVAAVLQDVPALDNGFARVRWDSTNTPGFHVEAWDPALGGWNPQGKMFVQRIGDITSYCDTWVSASLTEYTPDRAVITVVMRSSTDPFSRERVYVTMRRGQAGARFEVYPALRSDGLTRADARLFWQPDLKPSGTGTGTPDANDSVFKSDSQTLPSPASTGVTAATAGTATGLFPPATLGAASFAASENFVQLLRCSLDYKTVDPWQTTLAVLQAANAVASIGSAPRAYNVSDNFVAIASQNAAGYISAEVSFAATSSDQVIEAELNQNVSGTTSVVADSSASGGSAVQDTQTAETHNTVTRAVTNLPPGKYRMFARARVTAGTGSFRGAVTGAGAGNVVTVTSTTYVPVDLGDFLVTAPGAGVSANGWRSAGGAGNVLIDRVELFLVEDRIATPHGFSGARDLGQAILADIRQQLRRPSRN